jgi:hypothetical protein
MASSEKKHPGGRPKKFTETSRPVTVTLPERTLALLAAVSPDRAKAIAKVTDSALGEAGSPRPSVELVEVAPGKAALIVAHNRHLTSIPWLRLVEVAPARYLLSLVSGTPIERLEVAIGDLLEAIPETETTERELLETLRCNIRTPRRSQKIVKEEILFFESTA